MIRLVLWRHGRTAWNQERRVQGQLNTDLNEVGVAQAEQAAPRLAEYRPDVIISSDLRRAARTAQALAALTGQPVELDERLRERHFGPWQGLSDTEIRAQYPVEYERWGTVEPIGVPTIEIVEELEKRVVAAMRDAAERVGPTGTAVLVTHGGSARSGCGGLIGLPSDHHRVLAVLGNCHLAEVTHTAERGWQLRAYNI